MLVARSPFKHMRGRNHSIDNSKNLAWALPTITVYAHKAQSAGELAHAESKFLPLEIQATKLLRNRAN